jgi:hypothetical protein
VLAELLEHGVSTTMGSKHSIHCLLLALAGSAIALLVGATGCSGKTVVATRGAWRVEEWEYMKADGMSAATEVLLRKRIGKWMTVDVWLWAYEFTGRDCAVYERAPEGQRQIWCVCGEHEPTVVAAEGGGLWDWHIEASGIRKSGKLAPLDKGVVETTERISLNDACRTAWDRPRLTTSHADRDLKVAEGVFARVEATQQRFTEPSAVNRAEAGEGTLLERAIAEERTDLVEALIRAGASVNHREAPRYTTPLMRAAALDSSRILAMLLAAGAGATLDAQDFDGQTALATAALGHRLANVELLLAAGANPLLKDRDGKTAIDRAVDALRIRKMLTDAAARMNPR